MILLISVCIIPSNTTSTIEESIFPSNLYDLNIRYYMCADFNYNDNNHVSKSEKDDIHFYGQSNKSIYIVNVSSPNNIYLEQFSCRITQNTIGKQYTSEAFLASVYILNGTQPDSFPIMATCDNQIYLDGKLRYLHYNFGEKINFTFSNRTLYEYDNESLLSVQMNYPWSPIIPPGTWYFVFSSVFYDLDDEDVSSEWRIWMNFSDECSDLKISTSEGGKMYGLWFGEFDANVIVSKSGWLEMMFNGKKEFHIENTFLFWFFDIPFYRGFWNIKWITPNGSQRFTMFMWRGNFIYNEDDCEGCAYGIGKSGEYKLIMSYLDYGRTLWGLGFGCTPTFVGFDVKLP